MSKQIWVRKGQEVRGPFSVAQIRKLAEEGKLSPRHEISSDQKRWKSAADVSGLGLSNGAGEKPPAEAADAAAGSGEILSGVARSQGSQFALGMLLLVVVALVVAGACVLKLGFVQGGIVLLLFLLSAAMGYPAASLGRDVSAIYVAVMALVWVMLLGESPVRFGTSFFSWIGFAAGLIPGALIILGWMMVSRGLGQAAEPADAARLNPGRFSAAPISKREFRPIVSVGEKQSATDSAGRVELRLDPDDLVRADDSLGEKIEEEARRSVPGLAGSLVLHALLLAGLWFVRLQFPERDEVSLQFSWISAQEQTAVVQPEKRELELQAVELNQKIPPPKPKVEEKPLQPLTPGPGQVVPVKPVPVGGLFEGRSEENRRRLLAEVDNAPKIEQAISQGLSWFARQQQSAGNWQLHQGYPDAGERVLRTDTGATALALLCYLGSGQTHLQAKDKKTQEIVQKGLGWLKGIQKANGDFHDHTELGRQTAYYAHSQATIVMCEAYAMTKDRSLYEPAVRGVEFLLNSQQPNEGGWKYQPQDARSVGDLSVTGWALMALHSARAAGIEVPDEPFQRASKFLNSVQEKNGAFYKYEPRPGWEVSRSMTAEGLLCRQFLGWPRTQPQLREGVTFLLDEKYKPEWSEGRRNVYEWYYVGHVLHNLNDEEWTDWYNIVKDEIIAKQQGAGGEYRGSWSPNKPQGAPYEYAQQAGRLYITAMCLLILEMPYRHQPIYGNN